jgi:hypothetical protein
VLIASGSSSVWPIFFLGLRLANGFWNTICTARRNCLRVAASASATSWPAMRSRPAVGRSSIVTWRASVLLPHPDSPTTARVRPAASENDTDSSAFTVCGGLSKPVDTG